MRKIILIAVMLSCMSVAGYSQSNGTLEERQRRDMVEFKENIEKKLQVDKSTVDENYYYKVSREILSQRNHRSWFKENIDILNGLDKAARDSTAAYENYRNALQKSENLKNGVTHEVIIENKTFDLMPKNMINYLGKVNKTQFEEFVGEPVGDEDNFIVYEVESVYEKIPIAIRCDYHEKTGKLIHVHFPTPSRLGYELGFIHFPDYKKLGSHKIYKNQFGKTYRTDYRYKVLGMQVSYDGVISYHIVK